MPALKILTYNVHSCIGTDRKVDPSRVADVIASSGANIIALQELDVGRKRTGGIDQAHAIASQLKMEAHFHPALHVEKEQYGDAILTALPTKLVKAGPLPSIGEMRGALWIEAQAAGFRFNILNTHLGLRTLDRNRQMDVLLSEEWVGHKRFQALPSIICGDLNAIPRSLIYKRLVEQFQDCQKLPGQKPVSTYPSRFPFLRLDHIFASAAFKVISAAPVVTPLSRKASDHLPLLASVTLAEPLHNSLSQGDGMVMSAMKK